MLQIRQIGPQIGVEITGVDVKTMDEAIWSKIYQAWLDCNGRAGPGSDDPGLHRL